MDQELSMERTQELMDKAEAVHIAALNPRYVRREEIPSEVLEKEKEIERVKLRDQKKPEAMIEKILTGKIEKFFETVCLVDQPFVKDDKKKVGEVVTEAAAKIKENIVDSFIETQQQRETVAVQPIYEQSPKPPFNGNPFT